MKNKYYFSKLISEENCTTIKEIVDEMVNLEIKECKIFEAIREANTDHFYCTYFNEIGDKKLSCGKICVRYTPKNGKSGCCKYRGFCYSKGEDVILKLDKNGFKLFKSNN